LYLTLFGVVGLLRGDRLCGGSVDILGDRFLIEIRGDGISISCLYQNLGGCICNSISDGVSKLKRIS